MAELVRTKDWSDTPLGPIGRWPQSLRTTVSLCLASNFPINVIWGAENTQIYNDGYRTVCGSAHPRALGEDYSVTWSSAWPAIGEPFRQARQGDTSFLENQRMFLTRNGYLEETFFTFSLSPIRDETGEIGGLFHPVTETTATMLSERRTRALRDLNASLALAEDMDDLSRRVVEVLAQFEFDLPLVLLYHLSSDGSSYGLAAQYGLPSRRIASMATIDAHSNAPWPMERALATGGPLGVNGLSEFFEGAGSYDEPPDRALLLPIAVPGLNLPPVFVVAGASPRLPFDDTYMGFYELLSTAITAAVAAVRARTDERRRAEALAEIDRSKTMFFSNVSHEFRTPLTLMLGPLADVLQQPEALSFEDRQRILVAQRNGQRLLKLVNTLLDFSRIEAQRVQASFEPIDIGSLTAELASNFRSAIEQAGLRLVVDIADLPQPVYLDRDLWEKIVLNLLSNAFKFTFQGEIRISVRPSDDGERAEITIRDTGTGIAAEELPRLFERFHRIEGAKGRSFEGSGIGLALVQELVHLQGGEIRAESRLAEGTSFSISIPFGRAHVPSEQMRTPQPVENNTGRARAFVDEAMSWLAAGDAAGAASILPAASTEMAETLAPTGHVLLADDNADMRAYVERLLSTSGFTVETAADGEAALNAARLRRPDLIVSDVMMPGLDGFGLLSRIRADDDLRDLPLILLSARAGEEARLEGMRAGADDYLVKPFSARELVGRISASIRLSRDRREALLKENAARLEELNADLERRVLEHSRERGRTWKYSPDLLSVIDFQTGLFEKTNPAWEKTLGLKEEELLGTPLRALLHPDDVVASETAFQAAQSGMPVLHFENRCRTREGDHRWLSWVAVIVDDKLYSSARDVTEQRRRDDELRKTQETLRQAQKMEVIGQLTGGVAHDFNNLLMVISGGLDVLDKRDDPARRERIKSGMLQAVNRGASLTRQLLTFARRQPLKPQPIDLRHQISEMRELLDRTLSGDISIDVDVDMGVWPVQADPAELELVLLNLCVNARDAMPDGGTIIISASNSVVDASGQRGDVVKITVADSGMGMQPEVLKRVFEPFFTTKDIGKGSGLGLAQVYGFVEASGGSVEINSEPGVGTAVDLWLPRSIEASLGATGNHSSRAQGDADRSVAGKILVVEDDDSVAMLVNDMLDQLGYSVTRVDGAAAALSVLASDAEPDLMFSDIMMPGGINGVDLAKEVKQRHPKLPILLTSGYADVLKSAATAEGVEILPKPYSLRQLSEALRATIPDARE
ncbi:Putative sensor histidine kinase with multiple PAS and a response regulator receiver domain (Modular protein) [Neorhizobium galegae bv. officinalis bv. officinalis str. HAMBI 1141]|uniref:histidine kinase n=2 Tax=Neorhizobium galegae TaxID=399 RepID=A0A068T873_NEOGA|nr:Putative sensor histidine kinase with multiple PAS and a response regulator receiver domain (Modular protein) [Neorhizobium galegae bv. officinalis bv. officinalis str. HAMBI 1141]